MTYLVAILIVTTAFHVSQPQTVGTDCNGKTFLCLDNQSYQSCSQYSNGQTQTSDTTVNTCPVNQICSNADSSACSSTTTTEASTTTSTPAPSSTTSQPITTTTSSTTTVRPFTCEKSGRFPHESKCREFYLCVWYPFGISKIESTCLFGMIFDPTTQKCTHDQTKCQLMQPPFTCTSSGKFPDSSDPTRYFQCRWDGSHYELLSRTCWFGFTFNVEQAKCNGFLGF